MQVEATPDGYLGSDFVVQAEHPAIAELVADLRGEHALDEELARSAFEWVRDQVAHSYDSQNPRVTLSASEVLMHRTGLCFGKSHLLAAVLRSAGIPTGFCYQRLSLGGSYVLHGLIAVYMNGVWHRQDPRGNKPGISTEFSLRGERLAYSPVHERGEVDYARIYLQPAPVVISAFDGATNMLAVQLPSRLD
ncbi:transglutaminase family protein [Pseudarthrobacter oxydans]|uniref:transglutaminase-like domain-containing protein n=1 Tax=Pseudarthrobacter oxydans TaxID=1671 RepID=UPI003D2E8DAB